MIDSEGLVCILINLQLQKILVEKWFMKYMFIINRNNISIVKSKILHKKVTQSLLTLIRNSRRVHQLKTKITKFYLKFNNV